MSTAELKISLINRIANLNDDLLLEDIQRLLEFETAAGTYQLSDEQRKEVNEARAEFTRGEYLSENEANVEVKKWLEK